MPDKITPASIFQEISQMDDSALPPVHLWNPPLCENVDMRIDREGRWYFMNSPIGRERMVKLFSRVLRLDDDGFYYAGVLIFSAIAYVFYMILTS